MYAEIEEIDEHLAKRDAGNEAAGYHAFVKMRHLWPKLKQALGDGDALAQKLRRVHDDPAYKARWMCAHLHLGSYEGPTYAEELANFERHFQQEQKAED